MAYSTRRHPIFHPQSRTPVPLSLTEPEFLRHFAREGEYVEFKAGVGGRAIQRTVTAFSNSGGGVILFGVSDEREILGKSLTAAVETDVTQEIALSNGDTFPPCPGCHKACSWILIRPTQ